MEKPEEFKLSVPWGHIAAKAWGSPENSPVLCLHGILDNAGSFDRLIALLPKSYYYVSIDLPGHGFSSHFPPGIPLNFFNYILAVKYVTEFFKWEIFDCIGHSLGGQISIFYSIIYPNQIQRLISIEGIATITDTKNLLNTIRNIQDNIFKDSKELFYTYDEIMYTLRYKRGSALNSKAAEAIFNRAVTEFNGMYKFNRDFRLKVGLPTFLNIKQIASMFNKLNVKILLIGGRASMGSLESFRLFATNFKNISNNIELIYVDGNHDVHNNNPERISNYISKFLNNFAQSKL